MTLVVKYKWLILNSLVTFPFSSRFEVFSLVRKVQIFAYKLPAKQSNFWLLASRVVEHGLLLRRQQAWGSEHN